MKKLFTLFAFALAAASVSAQDAKITVSGPWYDTEDVTVDPTQTAALDRTGNLIINFQNSVPIQGYQFNVKCPQGVTFAKYDMEYPASKARYSYYTAVDESTFEEVTKNCYSFMKVAASDGSTYVGVFKDPDNPALASVANIPAGDEPLGACVLLVPQTYATETAEVKVYNIAMTDQDGNTIVQNESENDALIATLKVVPTGIEAVTVESLAGKEVFNLSGQRVASPTQRGIYIVNGKKLYVK